MRCIIIDDEPLARKAMLLLIEKTSFLQLTGSFGDVFSASEYMRQNTVDLIFLDIRMPEMDGITFAKSIHQDTLIIFTTAYSEYAIDSYEVDAVDYLVKPVEQDRFQKVVEKAQAYHSLLLFESKNNSIESISVDYMFVKSERRFYKIFYKDILFIEGLKDYVVIQTSSQRVITKMNLKTIFELLSGANFFRVSKSYIVNTHYIESFDNNDIFIGSYEIPIGNSYRDSFFEEILIKGALKGNS